MLGFERCSHNHINKTPNFYHPILVLDKIWDPREKIRSQFSVSFFCGEKEGIVCQVGSGTHQDFKLIHVWPPCCGYCSWNSFQLGANSNKHVKYLEILVYVIHSYGKYQNHYVPTWIILDHVGSLILLKKVARWPVSSWDVKTRHQVEGASFRFRISMHSYAYNWAGSIFSVFAFFSAISSLICSVYY